MRYITEDFNRSVYLLHCVFDEPYEEVVQMANKFSGTAEGYDPNGNMDFFQFSYQRHIKLNYSDTMFYVDEIKEIIFDKNGELRRMDETIYQQLNTLRRRIIVEDEQRYGLVKREAKQIQQDNISFGLNYLAKLANHDREILKAMHTPTKLELWLDGTGFFTIFEFSGITHLEPADVKKLERDMVVDEELFKLPSGQFEYNAFLKQNKGLLYDAFSVTFSEIVVRDIECGEE